ncbi:MAG: hypothetical protein IKJ27_00240 [Clostridia bacterium]|nr:hypothetical protein [Clostridia bacterium]
MASKMSSSSAWKNYQSILKTKPGDFKYSAKKPAWSYDDSKLNAYYDMLLNRKDFTFDLDKNALYGQYKDFYTKQGQLAMMDTAGQAAALTGGYGNSYATAAGQQAYQQNLDQLGEMVPEIYGLALQQYQMEGEQLYNKYALAAGERDVAYNQYLDNLNRYYRDYDAAYQKHSDSVDRWYNDANMAYGMYGDARDYEYQQERAAVQDSQWAKEFAESQRQSDREHSLRMKQLEADREAFERDYEMWEKEFNAKYGGTGNEPVVEESKPEDQGSNKSELTQAERLAALGMSEKEEQVVMDIIEEIQNKGMVGDTERLSNFISEYGKDLTLSQLKALRIIFLGE